MHDAAQFTLGLLDSSALGRTVPTPDLDADDHDDAPEPTPVPAARNYHLTGDRQLARGWRTRAQDNIAAIELSRSIKEEGRAATPEEQERLLRFIGFGASELAQNAFPLPGKITFRDGWEEIGRALADATTGPEYAALQRATQYAHYTPEPIIRALWRAAERLGFTGGRVIEPGMGTGLFFACMPETLRQTTRLTGIEYDPISARIAALIHPEARVRREDYTRSPLGGGFDLAIGNPPFADRVVRADPSVAALGLRLHDYFIARSIERLRPGGIAMFVTSTGTMDKASTTAREHIASMADLRGAVRLPEGSMRSTAGTDVVIDILVFQRRLPSQPFNGIAWNSLTRVNIREPPDTSNEEIAGPEDTDGTFPPDVQLSVVFVNEYFAAHPEMVLGKHSRRRGIYGPGLTYTCRLRDDGPPIETLLHEALDRLPAGVFVPNPDSLAPEDPDLPVALLVGRAADGATVKEGSYVDGSDGTLCQMVAGAPVAIKIRNGKGGEGISLAAAKVIRAFMPIRDAVREVLRAQATGQPWQAAQTRLRTAYASFVRYHGPINRTTVSVITDPETGEEREQHRRPNLSHVLDDPDCWLVASIETYDLDTGRGAMGPIFRERVVSPPSEPTIVSAADALAVTLNERGFVDPDHLGALLDCDADEALKQLGGTVFRDPGTERWETADAYLSGPVRHKLAAAEAAAVLDPGYARNVDALRAVQPIDLLPSEISARLGAPWLPTDVIVGFAADVLGGEVDITHVGSVAIWGVRNVRFANSAAATSEWGTERRHAGDLLSDALQGMTPQIYDTVIENGSERRVLNSEATEAAKEKLAKIKRAFGDWVWTDPDRAERLARIYNERFNNLRPRHFDGRHLTLPGASGIIKLHDHQKRAIWRIVCSGSTYVAHAVGAGKTYSMVAAIMEQRRLGLIQKPIVVVPGHCLAQISREFLQLYPLARILVADETNFAKDRRARFLARAATDCWDAIIITHAAFKFIAVPTDFERGMIEDQIDAFAQLATAIDDRITRKRVERLKERLEQDLELIRDRCDDMLTLHELGVDQLLVDEAQEFRKLTFATNRAALKGVDSDGSQRAWDLWVKRNFIETINPGRALIQASGTPITNTMGEMFTLVRYQNEGLLRERGVHAFDAWAGAFGDTQVELELQPSGVYRPIERFSRFVNVPELIDMFRTVADVVVKNDLRAFLRLPNIQGGQRTLITAPASQAFRDYQQELATRIDKIKERRGSALRGEDILLSVITDGRHAAIDMRLVGSDENEPENKLNALIANAYRIWLETSDRAYRQADGAPYPLTGAFQMIFSDLGTFAAESKRGFSAYRWIKDELIRRGVPASEIAIMQDFKRSADKQRLYGDANAGRVRFLIGSTATMGTGVNAQLRLVGLHHLDVPWLPADIEQREGRAERQGNQNEEIGLYAYATRGSMDATLWQALERKARFISAALAGDRSIRTIDDIGEPANQFALAKAIASGDERLLRKAGLEAEIARLDRQHAAHFNDQIAVRRQIATAEFDLRVATRRAEQIRQDLSIRTPTRGHAFVLVVGDRRIEERRSAGAWLLAKLRAPSPEAETATVLGSIGGFDLVRAPAANRTWAGETVLVLQRTELDQAIETGTDLTSIGLIARIEHVIDRMPHELEQAETRAADAARRLTGYRSRVDAPFGLQAELDDKRQQLKVLDNDLAGIVETALPAAA